LLLVCVCVCVCVCVSENVLICLSKMNALVTEFASYDYIFCITDHDHIKEKFSNCVPYNCVLTLIHMCMPRIYFLCVLISLCLMLIMPSAYNHERKAVGGGWSEALYILQRVCHCLVRYYFIYFRK